MKVENEITVEVTCDYETLKQELEKRGFSIKEEYQLNDNYMIDKNIDLSDMPYLEILKKCVLVREIEGIKKVLLYKYKKYAENGDILEQAKIECPITDIDKAIEFMKAINYSHLFSIYDRCIVFANDQTEMIVQLVNDEYVFIEMETKCDYVDRSYENADELKDEINRYDLPIDKSNYFVKKAEIMLKKVLKR